MVRRLLLLAALGATGCNSILGVHTFDDAAAEDSTVDTLVPPLDADCAPKRWATDFSVDPTTLDDNGDGTPDWRLRNGTAFPASELENGIWRSPKTAQPLDTSPPQTFVTPTHIEARLRGGNDGAGMFGGVVWINFAWDLGMETYSAAIVDVMRMSDTEQRVRLYTKTSSNTLLVLAETMTGAGFVDVVLDVNPATRGVKFAMPATGAGFTGVVERAPPLGAFDGFVSTLGYDTSAEIDSISVEVCDR